jgi:serine protease Do
VDRDGKKVDFKLTVQDRMQVYADEPETVGKQITPEESVPSKPETTPAPTTIKFGIQPRVVSEEERELTPDKHGVTVTRVEPGSFADEIGMVEGDIIIAINRHPISSVDDIRAIQQTLKPGDPVAFRVVVRRRGQTQQRTTPIFRSGTLPQN